MSDDLDAHYFTSFPTKECPGGIERSSKLIVECDGYEFHDRTKQQAQRDKSRDRDLQSLGVPVFFTGSEIWADPFKCATAALDQLVSVAIERG